MSKKNIKLVDLFLLIAAGLVDLYEEIKDPLNLFSSYYQKIYGYTPSYWKKERLLSTFQYCLKKKYLNKKSKFYQGKFYLAKKGLEKIKTKYPLLYWKKNKNKNIFWISFDIQELDKKKRERFRYLLKKLGFIMIHKSFWVGFWDKTEIINQWLKINDLENKIIVLKTNIENIKNKKIFFKLLEKSK